MKLMPRRLSASDAFLMAIYICDFIPHNNEKAPVAFSDFFVTMHSEERKMLHYYGYPYYYRGSRDSSP
jgi:hypothetical protein